jgi:hypothetical protein
MTVRELIKHLHTLPQDVDVIYRYHSEYEKLDEDFIKLHVAGDKEIHYRPEQGYCTFHSYWCPKDFVPDFRTVVVFPGN